MTGFTSMAERHAFGMEAVAEMTGKLLQAAYARAIQPEGPEERDRAILLFDRLARGFRLTLTLEARFDRDRRREAAGIGPDADAGTAPQAKAPGPPPLAGPRPARPSREADHEQDVDLEPSDLPGHVRDLRRMVTEDADILDPDGSHGQTLDRWAGVWGDVLHSPQGNGETAESPRRNGRPSSKGELLAASSPLPTTPWRASG